jgi:hypothetical protein
MTIVDFGFFERKRSGSSSLGLACLSSQRNAFGGRLKPLGQKLKAEFKSAGAFQEEVEG